MNRNNRPANLSLASLLHTSWEVRPTAEILRLITVARCGQLIEPDHVLAAAHRQVAEETLELADSVNGANRKITLLGQHKSHLADARNAEQHRLPDLGTTESHAAMEEACYALLPAALTAVLDNFGILKDPELISEVLATGLVLAVDTYQVSYGIKPYVYAWMTTSMAARQAADAANAASTASSEELQRLSRQAHYARLALFEELAPRMPDTMVIWRIGEERPANAWADPRSKWEIARDLGFEQLTKEEQEAEINRRMKAASRMVGAFQGYGKDGNMAMQALLAANAIAAQLLSDEGSEELSEKELAQREARRAQFATQGLSGIPDKEIVRSLCERLEEKGIRLSLEQVEAAVDFLRTGSYHSAIEDGEGRIYSHVEQSAEIQEGGAIHVANRFSMRLANDERFLSRTLQAADWGDLGGFLKDELGSNATGEEWEAALEAVKLNSAVPASDGTMARPIQLASHPWNVHQGTGWMGRTERRRVRTTTIECAYGTFEVAEDTPMVATLVGQLPASLAAFQNVVPNDHRKGRGNRASQQAVHKNELQAS